MAPCTTAPSRLARSAWGAVLVFTMLVTVATFRVQPHVPAKLYDHPWACVFLVLALGGLVGMAWFIRRKDDLKSFLASCFYILGMLTSVVFGLYPLVLPASSDPVDSLTVDNAKAGDFGLRVGLVWWIIGMILVTGYSVYVYRHFAGKVRLESGEEGY